MINECSFLIHCHFLLQEILMFVYQSNNAKESLIVNNNHNGNQRKCFNIFNP